MSRSTQSPGKRQVALRKNRLVSATRPAPQESSLERILQQLRIEEGRKPLFGPLAASFGSAVEALWANRTRSFLTILGIFIGVASVIAALTLTGGVSAYVDEQINKLGASTITISPAALSSGGARGVGASQTLNQEDVQSILKLPHVAEASPVLELPSVQVIYGQQNWSTQVEGVNTDFQQIQTWSMAQGSWFSQADDQQAISVAIIGDTVMHNLFDATNANPVGQTIRVGSALFRVGGVLAAKGSGEDDVIFVPFNTARQRLKNVTWLDQIEVGADSRDNVKQVEQSIETVLRKNHRLRTSAADDFTITDFSRYLQRAQQQTQVLAFLLVGIAAISLTVGGIGIMNIMLVSVTERTREIGIRMSIGARRRDIQNQFLIEALVLCLLGGIIGLALGLLVGLGVTRSAGLPFVVTTAVIGLPLAVSVAITMIFGLYPAIQAAHLDPVEALRIDE